MLKKQKQKQNELGASLVEYALLVALISIVSVVSIQGFSKSVQVKNLTAACRISNTSLSLYQSASQSGAAAVCANAANLCAEGNQAACAFITP